jgi:membrane-bound ClpP family serine protease
MDLAYWIIPVCFVWMVIGVFALGITSDRLKSDDSFLIGGLGDIFTLPLFLFCLLIWPIVVLLAIKTHRFSNQITPQPATHRLHQPKLTTGAEGISLTALQPTGKIEVAGVAYDAQVQHGFVEAGVKVVVCGTYMNHTMVKRVD